MAQPFHHTILPLASRRRPADRDPLGPARLRDRGSGGGRRASGCRRPRSTSRRSGCSSTRASTHTILAPWQVAGPELDTRRPYRVDVGDGRSIVVVALRRAGCRASVSFETEATSDADRFARERIVPRLAEPHARTAPPTPFALIATDGELYGHHQPFRDLFLQRLVGDRRTSASRSRRWRDVRRRGRPVRAPGRPIVERTSWSCHHGVARWETACECVGDGAWKAPLRAALDRLADGDRHA